MRDYNKEIFENINSRQGKSRWLDAFGRAGAEWAIVAACGWFVASAFIDYSPYWISALAPIITFAAAWFFAWTLNIALGFIVHEPRPHVSEPQTQELFRPLMHWKSFPSDHAMSAFLLFFMALIFGLPGSWALFVFAIWIIFGRIFAGVHYPIDMIGGFAVAACVAAWVAVLLMTL